MIYLLVILCFQIGSIRKTMSTKVTTLLKKIDLQNRKENASVIMDFYNYMKEKGSSENRIINNLKVLIEYVNYIREIILCEIGKKEYVVPFLNNKIKDELIDPGNRWVTTWNHYLSRLKLFFRWFHNCHKFSHQISNTRYDVSTDEDWITSDFIK